MRHAGQTLVPEIGTPPEQAPLSALPAGLRAFDQMNGAASRKPARPAGPERIGHQRSVTRPQLNQPDAGRLTHLPPDLACPQADQFPENLRYLGRCDEVSAPPYRVFPA